MWYGPYLSINFKCMCMVWPCLSCSCQDWDQDEVGEAGFCKCRIRMFLFSNFDILMFCSPWIFVLILIFKNIALEYYYLDHWVFWSPLELYMQGKYPTCGPGSCPIPWEQHAPREELSYSPTSEIRRLVELN